MWIASQYGFFSIVEKAPNEWHIRARVKQDLINLLDAAALELTVKTWPDADYRFRLIVDYRKLLAIFGVLEKSIDYPNFKSEIAKTPDQREKLDAYHRIWATMAELQEASER